MIILEKAMVLRGKGYGASWKRLWCFVEKTMVLRGKDYGAKTRKALQMLGFRGV
jgi:hypothetical protein